MSNKRRYVICHMGSTVDGRIVGENWGDNWEAYGKRYDECHNTSKVKRGWLEG